jgi:hypothetical protein
MLIYNVSNVSGFTNKIHIGHVGDYREIINRNDLLPDYEIPNWVYKKVFKHNKIKNKNNLKNLQEKNNKIHKSIIKRNELPSEDELIYNALITCNLPLGLFQPPNKL